MRASSRIIDGLMRRSTYAILDSAAIGNTAGPVLTALTIAFAVASGV